MKHSIYMYVFVMLFAISGRAAEVVLTSDMSSEELRAMEAITENVEFKKPSPSLKGIEKAGYMLHTVDSMLAKDLDYKKALAEIAARDACFPVEANISKAPKGTYGCYVIHKDGDEIITNFVSVKVNFEKQEREIYTHTFDFSNDKNVETIRSAGKVLQGRLSEKRSVDTVVYSWLDKIDPVVFEDLSDPNMDGLKTEKETEFADECEGKACTNESKKEQVICAFSGKMVGSSRKFLVGGHKMNGLGILNCANFDGKQDPKLYVKIKANGGGWGFAWDNSIQENFYVGGIGFNGEPSDMLGTYGSVGCRVAGFTVGGDMSVGLSLKKGSINIPLGLKFKRTEGIEASCGFTEMKLEEISEAAFYKQAKKLEAEIDKRKAKQKARAQKAKERRAKRAARQNGRKH